MISPPPFQITIVIPVLNDLDPLRRLLDDLCNQHGIAPQILIADGQTDSSLQRKLSYPELDLHILDVPPGRARQMNRATSCAAHQTLLFLHADSRLPSPHTLAHAIEAWHQRLASLSHRRLAGHFPLHFVDAPAHDRSLREYLESKTHLNRRGTFNGDQGLLIDAAFFQELGGFDESLPFMEDQRLSRQIHDCGQWMTLPGLLHTSWRRFTDEGAWRRYALMAVIAGADAASYRSFFDAIDDLYRPQHDADQLPLAAIMAQTRQLTLQQSPPDQLRLLRDVGDFVRQNTWQLFHLFDHHHDTEGQALAFFDDHLAPLFRSPGLDYLAGILTYITIFAILPAADVLTRPSSQ